MTPVMLEKQQGDIPQFHRILCILLYVDWNPPHIQSSLLTIELKIERTTSHINVPQKPMQTKLIPYKSSGSIISELHIL